MMGESAGYRTLLRVAAVAALVTVVVTVAQIVAFASWPPPSFAPTPSAALRFFGIAQARPLFAFVQLDGLTLIDYLLLIPVYLALYVALRHENPSLMLIGTVLSLFAITLYFTVNPAPAILVLAREYGAADSEAARSSIVSAGVGILGVMMLIPSTFGVIGLVLALGSLVPFVVWFALIALRLWRLGGGSDGRSPSPA
jgi:hypothetical protein